MTTNTVNRLTVMRSVFPERRDVLGDRDLNWFNNGGPQTLHQTKLKSNQDEFKKVDTDDKMLNKNDDIICTQDNVSREEVAALRKQKVAAKRQMKKMEKQQLKQIVSGVQVAKPDFSLEQATEDFPALCCVKKVKKTKCTKGIEMNANSASEDSSRSKPVEKSWKPKVKDPIYFNLSQALQPKPEKPKNVVKKIEPPINKLVGNILDSDSPTLNKGKVRPNKLKKLSKLKVQILSERNERQKMLSGNNENVRKVNEDTISPLYTDFSDQISNLLAKCAFLETDVRPCPIEEPSENQLPISVVNSVHSRRFREYCTNCITKDVVESVCALLDKMAYFQDRTFAKDPIKANAKRRYVAGFNETNKYLHVKKIKLLIIAPDLERVSGIDGLDDKVKHFKKEADQQGVPYVFGPNRKRLGKAVLKNALVSCVAILSYEGAEEQFTKVLETLHEAKLKYKNLVAGYSKNDQEDDQNETHVTSLLLATLKEELLSPREKLLSAINHCSY